LAKNQTPPISSVNGMAPGSRCGPRRSHGRGIRSEPLDKAGLDLDNT